jgi:RES domain-containing protein
MKPFKRAQAIKGLVQAVAGKATAWKGTVYRAVGAEYANSRDLLSGEGTKRFGGRWTPPASFATVHASLDVNTAVSENLGMQGLYGVAVDARLPIVLVAIDVQLQQLLNLTHESVLAEMNLTRRRLLRGSWRNTMQKGYEALTQALGRCAFEEGLEGLLVPSAQARKGVNLVVFTENLQEGSALTIQNVEKLPAPKD